jgi:hypothetical protein
VWHFHCKAKLQGLCALADPGAELKKLGGAQVVVATAAFDHMISGAARFRVVLTV